MITQICRRSKRCLRRQPRNRGRERAWKDGWRDGTRAPGSNDMEDFRRQAKSVAERLRAGADVLEVAPGPGFFAIELAKLGDFKITGLDASRTLGRDRNRKSAKCGREDRFPSGERVGHAVSRRVVRFHLLLGGLQELSPSRLRRWTRCIGCCVPGGEAVIADLRKDASLDEIDDYVNQSGRSGFDAWLTRQSFPMADQAGLYPGRIPAHGRREPLRHVPDHPEPHRIRGAPGEAFPIMGVPIPAPVAQALRRREKINKLAQRR